MIEENLDEATKNLQQTSNNISTRTKQWKIKLNEHKLTHINFTTKDLGYYTPVTISNNIILFEDTAKYLKMTLDVKLKWKKHVKKKQEELGIKYKKLYWLLGRNSEYTAKL